MKTREGVALRQSYLRVAKRAATMVGRYSHAHQFKCAPIVRSSSSTPAFGRVGMSRATTVPCSEAASILENHTGTLRRFQAAADVVRRPLVRGGD
jgi:hypothetical protein